MTNIYTRWRARRNWAHIHACYQFGHDFTNLQGIFQRHAEYDKLFRRYLKISKLMQAHGHIM